MPIPMVAVSHKVTGRKTYLPQTALAFLTDYEPTPSQKARDEEPDGTAFMATPAEHDAALIEPKPEPDAASDEADERPVTAKPTRRTKQS